MIMKTQLRRASSATSIGTAEAMIKSRPRQKRALCLQSMTALALLLSRWDGVAAAVYVFGSVQPCAFVLPERTQRSILSPTLAAHADITEEPASKQKQLHPSQPQPDVQRIRKPPLFPGASPIDTSVDIWTCINQTSQSSPTNALLGKPSQCKCRHGFAQAFSLDPMPPTQKINRSKKDRLNSGLLKLTCPLLVSSVDLLEDDGFMKDVNSKLAEHEGEDNEWMTCMNDAHKVHAETRKELIFGRGSEKIDDSSSSIQKLQSKLGERGAEAFLGAGVAGASPSATPVDVKCLHAWLADYLFRKVDNSGISGNVDGGADDLTADHAIGDAIIKALEKRGIDISGTDTCHEVCSGCSSSSKSSSDASILAVQVPIPRNKQRRKRRQLEKLDTID
mmetsp:Transcript_27520/g.58810  ORF Transcript_27520/g.58810 Transcript_27520/m.58810 type:complete len:392 (-) Transcript_27520:880-2055(-)